MLEMSWRRGQITILTQVLLTIAALLPHLNWGCSTVGHWGSKALCLPVALTSASLLPLTRTVCAPGYIIVLRPLASAVLPLIYTGASLDWCLGRGSIHNNQILLSYGNYVMLFLYKYVWAIDGILKGNTVLSWSGTVSNGNKEVIYTD